MDVDGGTYRVKQGDGRVLIYKRTRQGQYFRDRLFWHSGRGAPMLDSVVAKVLAKAARRATLTLSKGKA